MMTLLLRNRTGDRAYIRARAGRLSAWVRQVDHSGHDILTQTKDDDDGDQAFARDLQDGKVELKSSVNQVAGEEEEHEAGDEEDEQIVLRDSVEDVETISDQVEGREGDQSDLIVHLVHGHFMILVIDTACDRRERRWLTFWLPDSNCRLRNNVRLLFSWILTRFQITKHGMIW